MFHLFEVWLHCPDMYIDIYIYIITRTILFDPIFYPLPWMRRPPSQDTGETEEIVTVGLPWCDSNTKRDVETTCGKYTTED